MKQTIVKGTPAIAFISCGQTTFGKVIRATSFMPPEKPNRA
jgi:hypothetical protein